MSPNHRPISFEINRSFEQNETPTMLRYSSRGEDTIQLCPHGNNYEMCCNKQLNGRFLITDGNNNNNRIGLQVDPADQSHCHSKNHRTIDKKARRRLILASSLCLTYMIVEVVCGYFANSLAIMTDAAHLLTDFANYMISLFAIWLSSRPVTKRMSFGYYRAEVIGAMISMLMIWVVTCVLVYLAVERVRHLDYEIDAVIMLITSSIGIGVNIIMMLILGQFCESRDDETEDKGDKKNINVRAAFIDVVGDFIQSICVFSAAMIIYFKPEWKIVDPVCTFVFAVLVLCITIPLLKDIVNVLMEGLPVDLDFNGVRQTFFTIQGVAKVHNLRIWSLNMDKMALSAHVVINPWANQKDVLKAASSLLHEKYGFFEMTLQIEDIKADMDDCEECQAPKK